MNLIGSMKIQEEYICLVNLTGFDFGMIREGTICHVMFITSSYIKVSFNENKYTNQYLYNTIILINIFNKK